MMKFKTFIIFIGLIITTLVGCTRHNGDIGELFGSWRVTDITIDDEPMSDYSGSLYFAFQSSVFSMTYINEETHVRTATYASWEYQDDDLLIDFCEPSFGPLQISGMQWGVNFVEVVEFKGDRLVMSYENPQSVRYTYTLQKW